MSRYTTLADTRPMITEYLLPEGMLPIPRGGVTGLYGEGKIGKGRATWSIIAQVVNTGGTVIVILGEDNANEQVRPRAESAGVQDMSRVINLTRVDGRRFKLSASARHEGDIVTLHEAIAYYTAQGHDVRLVVIDPIGTAIGWGSITSATGAGVVTEALEDVAEATGAAIFLVMHPTKNGKLAGSARLQQALRLLYTITKDPANPLVRVIATEAENNEGTSSEFRFVIEDHGNGPEVIWLTEEEVAKRNNSWRAPEDTGVKTAILAALKDAVAPLSVKQVAEMTGRKENVVRTSLWTMKQRDQIAQSATGWSRGVSQATAA